MDGESSLYMCPCYKLFQSLEEVLVHQLTCQTAKDAIAPPPAEAQVLRCSVESGNHWSSASSSLINLS